jgi:PAS domain S-box-containing protein
MKFRLLVVLSWMIVHIAWSQTYHIINYKERGWFTQSQIICINQDSWGFMWFGTANGIFRYDGETWIRFTIKNGLPDNQILTIVEDDSHRLWIGTGFGLSCIDIGDYNNPFVIDFSSGLTFHEEVMRLYFWNNYIWIGTLNNGLYRLQSNADFPLKIEKVLSGTTAIFDIMALNDELLAVTMPDSGLFLINQEKKQIRRITDFAGDKPVSISNISAGRDILVGGTVNIFRLDMENDCGKPILPANISRTKPYIFKIIYDQKGTVWAATERGLIRILDDKAELISSENGLPSPIIREVFVDRENNCWIGSYSSGLFKMTDRKILAYHEKTGLTSGVVNSIFVESETRKLIGTDAGIFRMVDDRLERDPRFRKLDNQVIWRIYGDNSDRIWILGEQLLSVYDKGMLHVDPFRRISYNRIFFDAFQDDQGKMWLGHSDGMNTWENGRWEFIEECQGIPVRNVSFINKKSDGSLFIGTDHGMLIWHEGECQYLTRGSGFPVRAVNCFYEEKNGVVWLGSDEGLIKMQGETYTVFDEGSGFEGTIITQIMQDSSGIFWIGTENGLHRFDGKKVTAVIKNEHGLLDNEFVTHTSSIIDRDGRFWLGLFGGLNILDPNDILKNPDVPPRLFINKVKAYDNRSRGFSYLNEQNPVVPYTRRNMVFDFTGIYFRNEKDLSFQYRLNGVDEEWQQIGRAGDVRYHNLWPGQYSLEVRCLIDNQVCGIDHTIYYFTIERPFWLNLWFILTMIVLIVVIIFYLVTYQLDKMKRTQARLERQIRNRTRQLARTKIQLENIIENAGSAIVTVNLEKEVRTWNKRAEKLFGYAKAEIYNSSISLLDLKNDEYPFEEILSETDESGEMNQLELKKLTRDGREIELMITTTHLPNDKSYTIVMEDFTARNQLVQSVINREKLLGAIGALNKLLATLSHYINNALMAIMGMSQLTRMDPKYSKNF